MSCEYIYTSQAFSIPYIANNQNLMFHTKYNLTFNHLAGYVKSNKFKLIRTTLRMTKRPGQGWVAEEAVMAMIRTTKKKYANR